MTAPKRNALGRGLGALLDENNFSSGVSEVDIMRVEPSSDQPRKTFDPEKLEELSASIAEHGMIQPIIVCPRGNNYRIIAGERRWRAARMAGLAKVPIIVREASEREIKELALIENIQREDLNPIEEAMAYKLLIDEYNLTQEELSRVIGTKSRSDIANRLRLLNFCEQVRNLLAEGKISVGQARPLLALPENLQFAAAKTVIEKEMSARQSEAYVKAFLKKQSPKDEGETPADVSAQQEITTQRDIEYLQGRLRAALGTKVKLDDNSGKGKIVIEYYSKDERERLLEYLLDR